MKSRAIEIFELQLSLTPTSILLTLFFIFYLLVNVWVTGEEIKGGIEGSDQQGFL